MIQRIQELFDHFCYFNAWIFIGLLSVSLKSHPWHRAIPAFETFYVRYKDDSMVSLYVRISTIVFFWIAIFFFVMLFFGSP